MDYYAILTVATTCIVILAALLWWRSRSIAFPLGTLFLYYWSLLGGWMIVADLRSGTIHPYMYLYEKLFAIHLDRYYLYTLFLYSLFIIVIQCTALLIVRPAVERASVPLPISHVTLLTVIVVCAVGSYAIVARQLQNAIAMNVSGYLMTRGGLDAVSRYYTIHQILLRAALAPLGFGLGILCSGSHGLYVRAKVSATVIAAYIIVTIGVFRFCLLLGNRHEMFVSAVAGALLYLFNAPRPSYFLTALAGLLALAFIEAVQYARGLPAKEVASSLRAGVLVASTESVLRSTEIYAAHMSMYGALYYRMPLTWGSSVVSLLASIVPHILWPTRPAGIYDYYAASLGVQGLAQGFTIHHATGWYLNFGAIGVIAGAVLLGFVWAYAFNAAYNSHRPRYVLARIVTIIAPWAVTSAFPTMIRSGLESYKSLAFESILIPGFVLWVAVVVPVDAVISELLFPPRRTSSAPTALRTPRAFARRRRRSSAGSTTAART